MTSTKLNVAMGLLAGLGVVLAIIMGLAAFPGYVERIVEKKISDPEIIDKVRSQIRPMVVFNQDESILVDTGGMQYIESIRVILDQDKKTPKEIIVTPKLYLAVAPILESFDDGFVIDPVRGKEFQWVYKLGVINHLVFESATRSGSNRFRLEIIR